MFVELSDDDWAAKMKALFVDYRSEMRTSPYSRSEEYLHALAQCRGTQAGFKRAESFVHILRRKK